MNTTATVKQTGAPRKALSKGGLRAVQIVVGILLVVGMVLGTRVVSHEDPLSQGSIEFDPATFGSDNFGMVQEGVIDRAVDAVVLAEAIIADPDDAAAQYAVASSGGPVFAVTLTGTVGEGQSGIYALDVAGLPDRLSIRVQTGPAINGTELRDATGEIEFGQFTNQIEFQNAAAALNEVLKQEVLSTLENLSLVGESIEITGAFTLINPEAWLITPVEVTVR